MSVGADLGLKGVISSSKLSLSLVSLQRGADHVFSAPSACGPVWSGGAQLIVRGNADWMES